MIAPVRRWPETGCGDGEIGVVEFGRDQQWQWREVGSECGIVGGLRFGASRSIGVMGWEDGEDSESTLSREWHAGVDFIRFSRFPHKLSNILEVRIACWSNFMMLQFSFLFYYALQLNRILYYCGPQYL